MACGQAQMGKDTLADYLATKLNELPVEPLAYLPAETGPEWKRVSLAGSVKKIYCDAFGVDLDFIEKWKTVPENPPGLELPVRAGLQFIGDGFRKIKGSIWIDKLFQNITTPGAICSDGRYINELVASKAHGGFNILVVRPDKLSNDPNGSEAQIKPLLDWALNTTLEKPEAMQYIDAIIMNNGTKEELYKQVDALIPTILEYFNKR